MASREGISTFQSFGRSPLPLWAAALLLGQAWAGLRWPPLAEVEVVAPVGLGLALLARRRRAAVAGLLFLVGYHQVADRMRVPDDPGHVASLVPGEAHLRGRIVEVSEQENGKLRLLLDVEAAQRDEWRPMHGLVQLAIAASSRRWRRGVAVDFVAPLKRVRNFGNPGEFDYEAYLARRGVYVSGFLLDDATVAIVDEPPASWVDAWRARLRALLAELDSPAREILCALILGEMGALPRGLRQQFAAAGVSHVLSISGLHVAMVAGSAYAVLRWLLARSRWLLLRTRVPTIAAAASLAPVWLYAELAQAGVATWRSLAMLGLVIAAVVVGRRPDLIVSLAAAALLVAVVWPGVALDISFQLSFVSVLALVLAMERFWRWWSTFREVRLLRLRHRLYAWLGWALAAVAVNVSAVAVTAPLTAYHFNQVPLVAVLANPVVVPLLGTAAVALGLLGAVAALAGDVVARWVLSAAALTAHAGAWLTAWMASLPGAGLRVITPSRVELLLLYALMGAGTLLRGRARRRAALALLLLAGVDLGVAFRERFFRRELIVTFLSVGQGDSAVIEFPGSAVMVVDGGGLRGMDTGERIVAPFLWSRRIRRIDYLVLSHPDYDHYGGLESLARLFAPGEFWRSDVSSDAASYAALLAEVRRGGAGEVLAHAGDVHEIGGCRVEVLWPRELAGAPASNDASLVLRVQCGDSAIILPGDIEARGELGVAAAAGGRLRAHVLKVAHHGSRTSSTAAFLRAVHPREAVVSAGYRNRFGFPDEGVLRALRASGAAVHRTDLEGAVRVYASFGGEVRVEPTLASAVPTRNSRSTVVDSTGTGVYRPSK